MGIIITYYDSDAEPLGSDVLDPLAALASLNACARAGCQIAGGEDCGTLEVRNPTPQANACPDWSFAIMEGVPEEDAGECPSTSSGRHAYRDGSMACDFCGGGDAQRCCAWCRRTLTADTPGDVCARCWADRECADCGDPAGPEPAGICPACRAREADDPDARSDAAAVLYPD